MNFVPSVVVFMGQVFFWACIIMFCIGVLILVSPALVMRVAERMNRWISTDTVFHRLDSPTLSEPLFYRHHRLFGVLLLISAGYIVYQFAWGIDYAVVFRRAQLMHSHVAAQWLAHSLGFINVVFGIVVCCVGVVVFFRPSQLKSLERRANTWFEADRSLRRLDEQVTAPDRWFARNPRLVGLLVAAGSLYAIVSLRLFL